MAWTPILRDKTPELMVEIDFTNDPTNATRVWTDVTVDVRALSYTRGGRNHELQRSEAGTLNGVLNNRHGHYDPSNASSIYYPGVKRMRWIRVRARWSGVIYTRWTGLIESWRQEWPAFGKDAVVTIRATDSFKVLTLFDLSGLSYASQATGTRVSAVLTSVGATSSTVDTGQTTVVASGTFAEASMALPHLLEIEESENGLLFAEGDGGITFQSRHYRLLNSSAVTATIGEGAGEIPYRDASAELDDGDVFNRVSVTPSGGTAEVVLDATSKNVHYERRLNRSILTSSQTEARSAAEYLLGRYANPEQRIPEVALLGIVRPAVWPTILATKNSQRFTFKRRATASTISQDVFVERVSETVAPGRDWAVKLQLSPADTQAGWVLGDATYSVLGSTTRLSY